MNKYIHKTVLFLLFLLYFNAKAESCINYSPITSNLVEVDFILTKQIISAKIKNITSEKLSLSGLVFIDNGYPFSAKLRLKETITELSDDFVSSGYYSSRLYFEDEVPSIELETLAEISVSESLAHIFAQYPKLYNYLISENIELQFRIGFKNEVGNYYIECQSDWLQLN